MKRRSFFSTLATAVAGFAILPPATTYARVWRAQRSIPNPDYVDTPYEMVKYLWKPGDGYRQWQFLGVTCVTDIQECIGRREKFVISCDRYPMRFPELKDVWPEKPMVFSP